MVAQVQFRGLEDWETSMVRILSCGIILLVAGGNRAQQPSEEKGNNSQPTARQVFEQRIVPIFKSPNPSSCVQCHLAGVDLKNYIRPSQEQTFASLRDQGLIDLNAPEKSKIL